MRYKIFICFLLFFEFGQAQTINQLYQDAQLAYADKNYAVFLELTQQALKIHPSHPTLLLNEVEGLIHNKREDVAFKALKRFLSWDSAVDFAENTVLDSFLNQSSYSEELSALIKINSGEKQTSEHYLRIPKHIHVDDIEITPQFLILSDVRSGQIFRVNRKQNSAIDSIALPASALSVLAQDKTNKLVVTSSPLQEYAGYKNLTSDISTINYVDLSTLTIEKTITLPEAAVLGAMVFDNHDRLLITDSKSPKIYVVDATKFELINSLEIKDAFNLQGITYSSEDQRIYVADYIRGILSIDASDLEKRRWIASENFLLKGIDGLTAIDSQTIIAIQNNSSPMRTIKIKLDESKNVAQVEILDNNLNLGGEPTNGTYVEGEGFFYITNSPWPHYSQETKEPKYDLWEDLVINKIKL